MATKTIIILAVGLGIIGWVLFFYMIAKIYQTRKQEISLINDIKQDLVKIKKDIVEIEKNS